MLAAALLLIFASILCAAERPAKTIKLFNGKDLDGWYSFLQNSKYDDPKRVFTVSNGLLRITGEEWGGITTKAAYRDYHLIVEWRWGVQTWGERKDKARDSGILVHATGSDDAYGGHWPESIESQIIEGGAGDFIVVPGKNKPELIVECKPEGNQCYWQKGAAPVTKQSGRFNWYGRDREWKDQLGFRGAQDVEKPLGKWNRQEVICQDDSIVNIVNGVMVNEGRSPTHREGKITIQSEGAEIFVRRVELRTVKRRKL